MKRLVALLCGAALCLSLCGCGMFHEHEFYNHRVVEEPCAGMTGKMEKICLDCEETMIVDYPAEPLLMGDTFSLTIEKFTSRLETIGARLCPGMTVRLRADDWSAVTELSYNGTPFCEITYYDTDDYLNSPYPPQPMNNKMLHSYFIKHVNVLDFPGVPHAPNSFTAIAMTFDPLITEEEALELEDLLRTTRLNDYGNYLVTAVNGVGYGHAYPVNQLQYSGSIAIHAGSEDPRSCEHAVDTFTGDGVPSGRCTKCGDIVEPASWRYLTSMPIFRHSDNGEDVAVGNWSDSVGAVYWGALKFWVGGTPGLEYTEYAEYTLDGSYDTLSGTLVCAAESDPNGAMRIEIYLDGELKFVSENVGLYDYLTYMVDIRGARNVQILCAAVTDVPACGVVTAAVF